MKILIVDDNLLNQKIVSFHLKKMNCEVICVTNWREAMNIVKNDHLDLIFMDIMLPEKSGMQITHEIREYEMYAGIKERVPIVALTANTLDNDKEKCILSGMDDYITKPFSADDLYRAINNLVLKKL
ncbi:MAG: response regulator [Candidatus Cloacimonetes bacterium]|nr:response regulator [Candidatus Cloacimonadota bacterium]